MKKLSVAAGLLALALLSGPGLSQDKSSHKILISEEVVRIISAKAYSDLLLQAYEKGWRYPRSQIENGFKRHFEELKLQLIAQGYTIVSEQAESRAVEPAIRGDGASDCPLNEPLAGSFAGGGEILPSHDRQGCEEA